MYEMTNQIPFTACGPDGRLRLTEAIRMMMDSCQFQEYQEKKFCEFLRSNDIAVFLFSIQIDLFRLPEFREHVKTCVKIYGCKMIYGLRRITMRDESGRLCLISNATGAFFSQREQKALKLNPDDLGVAFDSAEEMECLPRKIPVPVEGGRIAATRTVMPDQLDPNGHLNSAHYFGFATDALPRDFSFNRIRAEFRRQAMPGSEVEVVLYDVDGKIVAELREKD
ncbi:MAG: thioesterase, partial [Victivallaceae bacterium]|nr:thioesterase [Victivallaceae bacterium]